MKKWFKLLIFNPFRRHNACCSMKQFQALQLLGLYIYEICVFDIFTVYSLNFCLKNNTGECTNYEKNIFFRWSEVQVVIHFLTAAQNKPLALVGVNTPECFKRY